jgi:hypothetical protein
LSLYAFHSGADDESSFASLRTVPQSKHTKSWMSRLEHVGQDVMDNTVGRNIAPKKKRNIKRKEI